MKKRLLCGLLTFAMVLSMLIVVPATTVVAADTYKASDNPVLITTAADLKAFRDAVNGGTDFSGKTVKLMADIDISGSFWTAIGTSSNKFQGTFDGQFHTISGLWQKMDSGVAIDANVGLFGYVQGGTTIKNFKLTHSTASSVSGIRGYNGGSHAGTVASCLYPRTDADSTINIQNVWSSVNFDCSSAKMSFVGGIVGGITQGSGYKKLTLNIDSCWYSGTLDGPSAGQASWGGIMGGTNKALSSREVNITNCLVTGKIIFYATMDDIGGIIGFIKGSETASGKTVSGSIADCVFAGTIQAGKNVYGYVVGEISNASTYITPAISISKTYYVQSYSGTAPRYQSNADTYAGGWSGYNYGTFSGTPTVKTLAEIKALTASDFSSYGAWYVGTSSDIPIPAPLVAFTGSGSNTFSTSGTTHTITTNNDMAHFAAAVNNGNTFEGHTVVLAADVLLGTFVGKAASSNALPFSGNFNGQGHTVEIYQSIVGDTDGMGGLISFIRIPTGGTVTVENVKVTGRFYQKNTTSDAGGYNGGFISCVDAGSSTGGGTLNLYNCWSNARLDYVGSRATVVGGFIGYLRHQYANPITVNIDSCLWDGVVNGVGFNMAGGFIAYTGQNKTGRNVTVNIKNSVSSGTMMNNVNHSNYIGTIVGLLNGNTSTGVITFNVENVISAARVTTSVDFSNTGIAQFNVNGTTYGKVNLTNFYYFAFVARNINPCPLFGTGSANSGSGTTKDVSGFQALTYGNFSERGKWQNKGTYYTGANSGSTSSMPVPAGIYGVFMGSSYTKFYDYLSSEYTIGTADELMNFANAVNEGCVYFTGKTVRLTEDIDLSGKTWQSIGKRLDNADGTCFRGTFNGQGHSVSNVTSSTSADATGAFFGYLGDGAVVTNTWFKAPASGYNITISSGSGALQFQGILANTCYGTVQITNVRNSMSLHAYRNVSYAGGFVGFMDNTVATTLTISGCVYDGTMDFGNYTVAIGGFVGYTGNNNGYKKTLTIENSMYAGTMNLNANQQYDNVAMFLGHARWLNSGTTSVTIRNCIATGKINFNNTVNWTDADYGGCGQVIGKVENNANVSYTVSNVYYIPSYLHMTAGSAATKRFLGEIGNDKGTTKKDIAGAHFCSPADLAALTLANLGGSGWTVPGSSTTTINVPVPTYVGSTFDFSKAYTNQYKQVTAVKSTSDYNGSIIYTASFYNTAGSLGISNLGTRDANCGVILISNTKFKALASSGEITFATLTASGYGTQVKALKYSGDSTCYTMRVVLKNFTTYTAKQSEEYFAIPYVGTTIQLDGARLVSYSAL